MKLIKTEEAVGSVLCHDITQIIPGVVKDAVFRKGHVVTQEDIPVLLSVGKEHLYVWEKQEGMLFSNRKENRNILPCHYMSFSKNRNFYYPRDDLRNIMAKHTAHCILGLDQFHTSKHLSFQCL